MASRRPNGESTRPHNKKSIFSHPFGAYWIINHWTVGTHSTARAMKTTTSEKNGPKTGRGVAWRKRILPLCMHFIDAAQFVSTLTVYRFSALFLCSSDAEPSLPTQLLLTESVLSVAIASLIYWIFRFIVCFDGGGGGRAWILKANNHRESLSVSCDTIGQIKWLEF